MTQKWDIIIIGGGLAGYVAANYLAKTDLSILILEKENKVGGRAKTNIISGQFMNVGPHALYKKGKALATLEELGIELIGKSPKLGGVLIENNVQYDAPFTLLDIFKTRLLNWKERIEWIRMIIKIYSIDPETVGQQTFQQWVQQTTHSKRVQVLLYSLCRLATYCHAPEIVSAKIVISHLQNVLGGVLYLDGGWQTIIDQLHNQAVISGVQVQSHSVVKQIDKVEHEHIKLVLSNDEEILGKYVISTTGPHELNKMLGVKGSLLDRNFFAQIKAVRGATLDVALTHLPNPKSLFALGITDPFYFSVHSNYARLSDNGKSTVLHVFKYQHPDDHIDGKKVKFELEQFLEKQQPGWQKYVITSRFIPQITVNHRLPQMDDEQKLFRSRTEIPRLYIAGDWASPLSILSEGAVSSGKQAAEEILREIG